MLGHVDVVHEQATPRLVWDLVTCATKGPNELLWGDLHFARDLARAIGRLGHEAHVLTQGDSATPHADVVLHLRGLLPLPPRPGAVNLLWVISHPGDVTPWELLDRYDVIYAAGAKWADQMTRRWSTPIHLLPQAADPIRFHPQVAQQPHRARGHALFVGNGRAKSGRKIVLDCLRLGASPLVYGANWEGVIPPELHADRYLPNEELPRAYSQARVVLNDHWTDMREGGFLSNRLFDAAFVGARIISDPAQGIEATFGPLVRTYDSLSSLRAAFTTPWPDPALRSEFAERVRIRDSFDARARRLVRDALACAGRQILKGEE